MGVRIGRNGGSRYRRRCRRLRDSNRGLVSVVGTLLALLVFFTLFGIFLTQFLPVWMTDNESQFAANTQTSMANLKSNVDLQLGFSGPGVLATPFTMASQGVPLIAAPTPGILNFIPTSPGVFANVTMSVGPGGGRTFSQNVSLGTLVMSLPNRYYSPQSYSFEDDAVVQSQTDQAQTLAFPLGLYINTTGSYSAVTMSMVQLFGNATQSVTTGTQEVYTHFLSVQTFTSNGKNGAPFTTTFKIGTHYPCAWAVYLQTALSHSPLAKSHWTLAPSTCVAAGGKAVDILLTLTSINSFTLIFGQISVIVGVGLG